MKASGYLCWSIPRRGRHSIFDLFKYGSLVAAVATSASGQTRVEVEMHPDGRCTVAVKRGADVLETFVLQGEQS